MIEHAGTRFHFEKDGGKYLIVLDSPLVFTARGTRHVIEAGYRSNGMSVPRLLWSLISPQFHPRTLYASVVHDYAYEHFIMCRCESDRWYRDALIEDGYAKWKAWLVYFAVRLFGKSHWECSCN